LAVASKRCFTPEVRYPRPGLAWIYAESAQPDRRTAMNQEDGARERIDAALET